MNRQIRSIIASILNFLRRILSFLQSTFQGGSVITFDTGRKVRLGRQIAEGGFSFVFIAKDVQTNQSYALKRITCPDREILESCRREAGVHRAVKHPNVMPLLGMSIIDKESICYMLFPYYTSSLRSEVNRRVFDLVEPPRQAPWTELAALRIFWGVLCAVEAMHACHLSHRDIKLENVLLDNSNHPVLMDFGSAGPLKEPIETRRNVMMLVEEASMHTTLPYRPPELLEGGVRYGDAPIDFAKVDVWSLGCTLFAILYGASPFESEFSRSTGVIRIVDCTQLKVINGVSWPPSDTPSGSWYSQSVKDLVTGMLDQDRMKRLTMPEVMDRVEDIVQNLGGIVSRPQLQHEDEEETDETGIALMSKNFV